MKWGRPVPERMAAPLFPMSLLLETIRIQDGKIHQLDYHNRRFNSSRNKEYGIGVEQDLGDLIEIPYHAGEGTWRCRIIYNREIQKIEFVPHSYRKVKSLRLMRCDDIDYSLKYADRNRLNELLDLRGNCDDILIIKNGFITDTSISNIVFLEGQDRWITPDTPLLNGTMRTYLLETGQITEAPVQPGDLPGYKGAKMINCMMGLDSDSLIEMSDILA